jgi:hypothetical protein
LQAPFGEGANLGGAMLSSGQSGKISTSLPLATKFRLPSCMTCAIPAPSQQAPIIVSTSDTIRRAGCRTGTTSSPRRNSHAKGRPVSGS